MHSSLYSGIINRELKVLDLGNVPHFEDIRSSVKEMMKQSPSIVTESGHGTNWTKPYGNVYQWNLFSNGLLSDTKSNIGRCKESVLDAFIEPFNALNFRINLIGTNSGLSQHIETIEIPEGLKVRYHVPIETNERATVFLDGDNYNLKEGRLYYFNNGCCHAADNKGKPRIHLVFDCLYSDILEKGKEVKSLFRSDVNILAPKDTD